MAIQNHIIKVQKRNRALVTFDEGRICRAVLRAAETINGFRQDYLPGINDKIFEAYDSDERIAGFIADAVVFCLNSQPHHLIANFPPTIEAIQEYVLHALRSYGFQNTADAFECYRWGRHWLRRGKLRSLVDDSLAAYETSLDEAARKVMARLNAGDNLRMMWVSGPSSSGKTTTTVKLTERLQKHGLKFLMLNLDDYFWALIEHPSDWINDRNFETPEALDIQLLNRHLRDLLDGKTIEKPVYSFKEGRRVSSKPVKLEKGQILLLDCLHGFYPPITEGIDPSTQFRLYIETLNVLYEGDGSTNRLTKFTDVRLIRRMLRDVQHRNHSPLSTILHWHYVRAGELFSIIPLMGLADHIVSGGLPFDLAALKPFFIGPGGYLPKPEDFALYQGFLDARIRYDRVKTLLESVEGITREQADSYDTIPGDSVIREFIGKSTVKIPHNE